MKIKNLSSFDSWDHENGFYWFSHKSRINKLLSHYELYKSIINIPGDVIELGVYKLTSIIRFATFRDCLENDFSRKIIGFDSFGEFPITNIEDENDLKFISDFESKGGTGLEISEGENILKIKGFNNVELVKGNIFDSLPKFFNDNPEVKISLLHLDMDVKEPTAFALEYLYSRLSYGGVIIIDDYNAVSGATEAVDQFLSKRKEIKIEKLKFYKVPSYIIKK